MKRPLRRAVDLVTMITARTNAKRTHRPWKGPVLVNLGSGLTVAPGWINVDSSLTALLARAPPQLLRLPYRLSSAPRWFTFDRFCELLKSGTFIHADVTVRIPLPSGSADAVYTGHMVEHLYREDAERLFREAFRVLKETGVFRINVPSIDDVLARFERGETEEALAAFFPRNRREAEADGFFSRHRYLYDFPLLRNVLQQAGFVRVERRARGVGSVPDLDELERRSPTGLYVEAFKSAAAA